jgi:hypothetical protein
VFLQRRDGTLALDPTLSRQTGILDATAHFADASIRADVSTDDWPFLYMPTRTYPLSYLGMIALILALSGITTRSFVADKPGFGHVAFFLLGAGFMLVETKAITELGLVFGNTWHVIGIVISGILVMAFLANWLVQRFHIRRALPSAVLLLVTLAAGFLVSKYGDLSASRFGKPAAVVVLTCPMLFSGIVFSTLLARARDITGVMAVNVLGAMAGGVLEYNAMFFGFRFLYILAMAFYALAILAFTLNPRSHGSRLTRDPAR